jgi:hypothetical protein
MQACLSFQLLRPPRAISQDDEDGTIRCFPTDAIQFEEIKASQLDSGGSFKLNLCECESVSGGNEMNITSRSYPCQHRGYRHQRESHMSLLGEKSSRMMRLPKDGELIGNNDGVSESSFSTYFASHFISSLILT